MDASKSPPARRDLLVVAVLLGTAAAAVFALDGAAVDDSWIVLRYVRNILDGHGWVYNAGEFVNGSTSALNTIILATLGFVTGGNLRLAQELTLTFAIGGTSTIWYFELLRYGRGPACVGALVLLLSPMPFMTLGMESTLVLFFGSAAVAACIRSRFVLSGIAFGLLFLARGDGILLGLPLALHVFLTHRRPLAPACMLFGASLLTVAPWLTFSTLYFGSPVPQTFSAKLAQTAGGAWGDDTFFAWIPHYLDFLDFRDIGLGPWPFAAVLAVGTFLVWRHRERFPALPLVFGWCFLQCAAYSALRIPRYHWYFTQLLFATTLGLLVIALVTWGRRREPGQRLAGRHLAAIATCCAWLFVTTVDYAQLSKVPYPVYQKAAKWLVDNAPEDASIAAMDIGILGYQVWPRRIVDMCSLVHRDGVADIARGETGWWHRKDPDYVVVHVPIRGTFEQPVVDRADFLSRYEFAADPVSGIRIYRRRTEAAPR